MNFKDLEQHVPYVFAGELHSKQHVLHKTDEFEVGWQQPGKYRKKTIPLGGDLVVTISDHAYGWQQHKFTHAELFMDLELKRDTDLQTTRALLADMRSVLYTADPDVLDWPAGVLPGVHPHALCYAGQLLGLAEWRRYKHMESRGGGRTLFLKFAELVLDRKTTGEEAGANMRRGLAFVRERTGS